MDLGEGPGGLAPLILGKKKKKSQGEEKPAGQAKQNCPQPTPFAQGLDLPLLMDLGRSSITK